MLTHGHDASSRDPGPGTRAVEQLLMKQNPRITAICKRWQGPGVWNYACDYYVKGDPVPSGELLQVDRTGRIIATQGVG